MRASFMEKPCPDCKGTGKVKARTKSGQGRMAKTKGSATELRVAKMIATAIGVPYEECRRTPNSGALIERGDLRLSNLALERFPWFVEVKARESWDFSQLFNRTLSDLGKWEPIAWFHDAIVKMKSDAKNGFGDGKEHPVLLVLLQNRKPPLAMTFTIWANGWNESFVSLGVGYQYTIVKFEDVLMLATKKLAENKSHE